MSTEKETTLHIIAGTRADGELVYEQVRAVEKGDDCYTLKTSPLFAKGAAKDDVIRMLAAGRFEVEEYGGNLCVRVLAKQDVDVIAQRLAAPVKALSGSCDFQNERSLVYSIPVAQGFKAVEQAFDEALKGREDHAIWLYANVYDPVDGQTPLNWWHDYLAK